MSNGIPLDLIVNTAISGVKLAIQGISFIIESTGYSAEQKAKAIERIQREAEVLDQKVQSFRVHPFRGDADLDGHG